MAFNPDSAHSHKHKSEIQSKLIQTYKQELIEIYKHVSNKSITPEEALECIKSYKILPTRAFMNIIFRAEISFKEFLCTLLQYDEQIDDMSTNVFSRQAGLSSADRQARNVYQEDDGLFLERKRSVWDKTTTVIYDKSDKTNLAKMLGKLL